MANDTILNQTQGNSLLFDGTKAMEAYIGGQIHMELLIQKIIDMNML